MPPSLPLVFVMVRVRERARGGVMSNESMNLFLVGRNSTQTNVIYNERVREGHQLGSLLSHSLILFNGINEFLFCNGKRNSPQLNIHSGT